MQGALDPSHPFYVAVRCSVLQCLSAATHYSRPKALDRSHSFKRLYHTQLFDLILRQVLSEDEHDEAAEWVGVRGSGQEAEAGGKAEVGGEMTDEGDGGDVVKERGTIVAKRGSRGRKEGGGGIRIAKNMKPMIPFLRRRGVCDCMCACVHVWVCGCGSVQECARKRVGVEFMCVASGLTC